MADYDRIVVGGGIIGMFTGYYLAKQGKKTLILEQQSLPLFRGGSHGEVRILRKAHKDAREQVLLREAFTLWKELENETNIQLTQFCKMLMCGEEDKLASSKEALRAAGISYETLSPDELQGRFPDLGFNTAHAGIIDNEAGLQLSNRIIPALQELFTKAGGEIKAGEAVTTIDPGEIVRIITDKGQHTCNSLILTPGAWINKLLSHLDLEVPLKLSTLTSAYWKFRKGSKPENKEDFPMFVIESGSSGNIHPLFMYGFPEDEYPYQFQAGCFDGKPVDLSSETLCVVDEDVLHTITASVNKLFPNLEEKPLVSEQGIVDTTTDGEAVMDCHPTWKNIIIGAGFSFSGYKRAPVVGKILGQLADGAEPDHDVSSFKLSRFLTQSK